MITGDITDEEELGPNPKEVAGPWSWWWGDGFVEGFDGRGIFGECKGEGEGFGGVLGFVMV